MTPNEYIDGPMNSIGGWLFVEDAQAMIAVDGIQKAMGLTGSLFEIGVYRGKSLALLALLARPTEKVMGLDLFTLGRSSMDASTEAVSMATDGKLDNLILMADDSQTVPLKTFDVLGGCRMVHIDGGHSYREVWNDMLRFAPMVKIDGVVIMDDYHQRDDPGVAAAVWAYSRGTSMHPFLSSRNKMFLAYETSAPLFIRRLITSECHDDARLDIINNRPLLTTKTGKPMANQECLSQLAEWERTK